MSYFLRFDNKFFDFQIRIRPDRIMRASRKTLLRSGRIRIKKILQNLLDDTPKTTHSSYR